MDHYKETFETWNKIASLYEDKFMYLDLYNETYDFFSDAIRKENAGILDIGCGPGNISKYLLSKRPDFRVEGIDIAPNMIELAKKNNPTANFRVLDSREISSIESKFDGIICGFCLPFLSESESKKLVLDSFQLLTENGVLYLSFVEGDPADSDFKTGSSGDRIYFHFHKLENLDHDIVEAGFEKPKIFRVNYTSTDVHTILIAKKKIG